MIFSLANARLAVLWLAVSLFLPAAGAQETPRARLNHEYRLINQQPVESADNLEVIEFFWYGCPYCHQLQSSLEEWIKRKPADVVLRRVPALLGEARVPHARIYYALEMLGELDRLHQQVYRSYHIQHLPMGKPDAITQWAVHHGIDPERWVAAYSSAEVTLKTRRAQEITQLFEVRGTPSFVVGGRYLTSSSMAGGVTAMMPVVDEIIKIARQHRGR